MSGGARMVNLAKYALAAALFLAAFEPALADDCVPGQSDLDNYGVVALGAPLDAPPAGLVLNEPCRNGGCAYRDRAGVGYFRLTSLSINEWTSLLETRRRNCPSV